MRKTVGLLFVLLLSSCQYFFGEEALLEYHCKSIVKHMDNEDLQSLYALSPKRAEKELILQQDPSLNEKEIQSEIDALDQKLLVSIADKILLFADACEELSYQEQEIAKEYQVGAYKALEVEIIVKCNGQEAGILIQTLKLPGRWVLMGL